MIDNTLSQLDSSVYTQIFIPTDGEISPDALKYQKQVRLYIERVTNTILVLTKKSLRGSFLYTHGF